MNLSRKSILPETRSKKWRLLNLKAEAQTKQIAAAHAAVIVTAEVAVAIATAADLVIKTETAADAAAAFMQSFVTEHGKIVPRRISGNCAKHQRQLTTDVKRARNLALVGFVSSGADYR
jgi:small subunit ribosomal protein S18